MKACATSYLSCWRQGGALALLALLRCALTRRYGAGEAKAAGVLTGSKGA